MAPTTRLQGRSTRLSKRQQRSGCFNLAVRSQPVEQLRCRGRRAQACSQRSESADHTAWVLGDQLAQDGIGALYLDAEGGQLFTPKSRTFLVIRLTTAVFE